MPKLFVVRGSAAQTQIDLGDEVMIGRGSGCALQIFDEQASRRHAAVKKEGGEWVLLDMKSSNGTRLNGARVEGRAPLGEGARIEIGDTVIVFGERPPAERETVFVDRPGKEQEAQVRAGLPWSAPDPDSVEALKRVREASRAFARQREVEPLLDAVLATVMEEVPAERGAVILYVKGRPLVRRRGARAIHISQGIIDRVREEKRALLLADLPAEPVLGERRSILEARIAGALVVPFLGAGASAAPGAREDEALIGLLYLDSTRPGALAEEHLTLALALAREAAPAIGNAVRLSEQDQVIESLARPAGEVTLLGQGPAMRDLRDLIGRAADSDATVLIQGETGTGKELVARMLHTGSPRSSKPFVAVNCAAIAESLFERELFGHVKGAFTGAHKDLPGKFEVAQSGTLFLDEIGDLSPAVQSKLLRALEEKEIEPVGGTEPIQLDVRIIAATNRDLAAAAGQGRFRLDLLYRLKVLEIVVPPLRARREDIPELVAHFAGRLARKLNRPVEVTPEAVEALSAYAWPGNVRELENVLERAAKWAVSSGMSSGCSRRGGAVMSTTFSR